MCLFVCLFMYMSSLLKRGLSGGIPKIWGRMFGILVKRIKGICGFMLELPIYGYPHVGIIVFTAVLGCTYKEF